MRFDVTALRWLLVLGNVVLLAFVGWVAFAYFLGERDELSLALPDPAKFEVKERKRGTAQNRDVITVLRTLRREPPPPPPVRKPEEKAPDLPAQEGGPLAAQWELMSVYAIGDDAHASIKKKTTVTTGRASTGRRRATRPSRTRTNSKAAKPAARRGPKTPTKHLRVGNTFRVEGKEYACEKIEFDPERVFYRDGGRLYSLAPPESESKLEVIDGVAVLTGIPFDEDDAAAMEAEEDDTKGAIEFPGKGAKKASPTAVPRTPTNNRNRNLNRTGRAKLNQEDLRSKEIQEALKGAKDGDPAELQRKLKQLQEKKKNEKNK